MDPNQERTDEHLDAIDDAQLDYWARMELSAKWFDDFMRERNERTAKLMAEIEQIIEEEGW